MDLGLAGKRALITGGSKGIGLASAVALAAEGVDVLLIARDRDTLDAAATALRARHQVSVTTLSADLSTEVGVLHAASAAEDIDILVNNAGAIPPGSLRAVDDATWRRAWDLKVFGFISLCRAVYPTLAARASGAAGGGGGAREEERLGRRAGAVIVNVIGAAGEKFDPNYIAGSTGNAALMAFTRSLGRASTADGIRVVGINPGLVATERMEMLLRRRAGAELGDAERWRELATRLPFGRGADPEEIGAAVAFLASDRSGYTSGTVLTIDGGG